MKKLNDYERGFIEAAIDSDGGIYLDSLGKKRTGISRLARVKFFNNSVEFLEKIQKILGINKTLKLQNKKLKRKCKVLQLGQKETKALLEQITLVIKEKRRIVALKFIEYKENAGPMNKATCTSEYRKRIEELTEEFFNC